MPKSSSTNGYYEAIIQIRPDSEQILKFIHGEVEKRGNVFISKEVEYKTGRDIYISDQHFAQALGKKIKNSFKGSLKITRTLYGVNRISSKILYRVTILFRSD